jgi:hypothetical protein
VDGSDQFCGDQSAVEWDSIIGAKYYIFVHGYLQSHGNFHLSLYYGNEEIGEDLGGNDDDALYWEEEGHDENEDDEKEEEGHDDNIDNEKEDENGEDGHYDGEGNWMNTLLFGGF